MKAEWGAKEGAECGMGVFATGERLRWRGDEGEGHVSGGGMSKRIGGVTRKAGTAGRDQSSQTGARSQLTC